MGKEGKTLQILLKKVPCRVDQCSGAFRVEVEITKRLWTRRHEQEFTDLSGDVS